MAPPWATRVCTGGLKPILQRCLGPVNELPLPDTLRLQDLFRVREVSPFGIRFEGYCDFEDRGTKHCFPAQSHRSCQ